MHGKGHAEEYAEVRRSSARQLTCISFFCRLVVLLTEHWWQDRRQLEFMKLGFFSHSPLVAHSLQLGRLSSHRASGFPRTPNAAASSAASDATWAGKESPLREDSCQHILAGSPRHMSNLAAANSRNICSRAYESFQMMIYKRHNANANCAEHDAATAAWHTLLHSRSSSSEGGHRLRWCSQKASFSVSGTSMLSRSCSRCRPCATAWRRCQVTVAGVNLSGRKGHRVEASRCLQHKLVHSSQCC